MIDFITSESFLVRFGQTAIIATGLILWVLFIIGYRHKMQDRKYKP